VLILGIIPGASLFISLHNKTPSLSASSNGKPKPMIKHDRIRHKFIKVSIYCHNIILYIYPVQTFHQSRLRSIVELRLLDPGLFYRRPEIKLSFTTLNSIFEIQDIINVGYSKFKLKILKCGLSMSRVDISTN